MASVSSSRSGRSPSDLTANTMSTTTSGSAHPVSSATAGGSSGAGGARTLHNLSRDPSRDQVHREIIEMSKTMSREHIDDLPSPRELRTQGLSREDSRERAVLTHPREPLRDQYRDGKHEHTRDQFRERDRDSGREQIPDQIQEEQPRDFHRDQAREYSREQSRDKIPHHDRDLSRERILNRMSSLDRVSMGSMGSSSKDFAPRDRRLYRGTSLDRHSSLDRASSHVSSTREFSYDSRMSLDKSHETMIYPSREYINHDAIKQDESERCLNNGCHSKTASLRDVSQLIESMEQKVPPQNAVRPQTLPVQRPKMVSRGNQFPPRPYIRKKAQSQSQVPEGEEEEEELFPTLKSVFRPIFNCLKCFGLMWKELEQYRLGLFTVHSVFVLLLAWINACRFFAVYSDNTTYGPGLLVKILIHLWMLQMAVGLPYCIFTYQESLHKIIKDWEAYKIQHTGVSLKFMKWFCFKVCIFGNGIFGIFGVICIIASLVKPPDLMYILLIPFTYDRSPPAYAWFLYYIFHFYMVAVWLQPLLILITTTVLLAREFNEAAKKLESSIKSARKEGTVSHWNSSGNKVTAILSRFAFPAEWRWIRPIE